MKLKIAIMIICTAYLFTVSCGRTDIDITNDNSSEQTDLQPSHSEQTTVPEPDFIETEETTESVILGNALSSDRCFFGAVSDTADTYTGFAALQNVDFSKFSFDGADKYSTEMISHSYGVAKNEIPHDISKNNQNYFDELNFDALCLDNSTDDKVVYLTFDCGYENGYTEKILDTLKEKQVTAAFFCTLPQVKSSPEIVARMITEGHIVGNHSVTHPDFAELSIDEIVDEIKGFDDYIRENFGYSSLYFRYPQGKYSEKSTFVINTLGYKCVFWSLAYADWDVENPKGKQYALDTVMSRLHPGAVILLHSVSPDNAEALGDIIDAVREKGYTFLSLEELGN